jgi:hypothetical protein
MRTVSGLLAFLMPGGDLVRYEDADDGPLERTASARPSTATPSTGRGGEDPSQ